MRGWVLSGCLLLLLGTTASACGGATASGDVPPPGQGLAFTPTSTQVYVAWSPAMAGIAAGAAHIDFALADYPITCSDVTSGITAEDHLLEIELDCGSGTVCPATATELGLQPGSYKLDGSATVTLTQAHGQRIYSGQSGSVTLATVAQSTATGSYDVVVTDGVASDGSWKITGAMASPTPCASSWTE